MSAARRAEVRERVAATRRALGALIAARAGLVAVAAGLLASLVMRFGLTWAGLDAPPAVPALTGSAVAAAAFVFAVRRAGGIRPAPERVALWLEERDPTLRWALVTALEGGTAAPRLDEQLRGRDFTAPLRTAARRALAGPALALLVAAAAAVAGRGLMPNVREAARARSPGAAARDAGGALVLTVRVTPPAYARVTAQELHDPSVVRALVGSTVSVRARDRGPLRARTDSGLQRVAAAAGELAFRMPAAPIGVRIDGAGGRSRILALEPVPDSAPVVTLRLPVRDSVLRDSTGRVPLGADVRDDLGLRRAAFEYVVSSGEGETFTFASGVLGARALDFARQDSLRARVELGALRLKPGDIVHLRAVAWDARGDSGAGRGVSETRTLRIARRGEFDSVAVEAAAPAEADKSLLSQRMLINLAEALVKRRRTLGRAAFAEESRRIALDQGRLRKQVAEIVFARLGDDPSGEHFHGDGHEHGGQELRPAMTPDEVLKAAENATRSAMGDALDLHDETPVVAVNRPLLEAYNAMWDAGRELEQISPERALPHMYRALDGIQRARNAERLYLRSRPPRAVVDVERVRLQGKDRGDPGVRSPRPPEAAADREALQRFAAAVAIVAGDPAAAADSLLLLRIAVLERHPRAAEALGAAADALRAGREATAALVRARRALDGGATPRDSLPRWSRMP